MPNKFVLVVFMILLVLVGLGGFAAGRSSTKPRVSTAVANLLGVGQWTGLVAGIIEDSKSAVQGVRLDICLKDTQTLVQANESLSEALSTSEARLNEALRSASNTQEALRKSYEASKILSEKLYSKDCKDWADAPVCPGITGLLRSERSEGDRGDRSEADSD